MGTALAHMLRADAEALNVPPGTADLTVIGAQIIQFGTHAPDGLCRGLPCTAFRRGVAQIAPAGGDRP